MTVDAAVDLLRGEIRGEIRELRDDMERRAKRDLAIVLAVQGTLAAAGATFGIYLLARLTDLSVMVAEVATELELLRASLPTP